MLIVAGAFEFAPEDRDAFVASKHDSIVATRSEGGCLEYAMSPDPVDPTRVLLFERWEDQASFDAHMAGIAAGPRGGGPAPKGMSIEIYDVAGVRTFG